MRAALLCLLLCALPLGAVELRLGEEEAVSVPLCVSKEDAIRIAKADSEQGVVKAREVFSEIEACDRVTVLLVPRRVLWSGPTERGATVRVVEAAVRMADDSTKTYYMIVDVNVRAGPGA